MRIAYVSADPGVPVFGHKGCSAHVWHVIAALRRRWIQVELFTARPDGDAPYDWDGVKVHRLALAFKAAAAAAVNEHLRSALQREGPFDAVYERYSLWSHAAMEHAAAAGVPGLLEVNAPLIEEAATHRGLSDPDAARAVAKRSFNAASTLIAVSGAVADYLREHVASHERVQVIHNGADTDRFRPGLTPSLPAPRDAFTIGFVGSMKPWHGLDVLVDTFGAVRHRWPEARLLMVGDGKERQTIQNDLAQRGLMDAVHFTGAVAAHEVPGLLASMDATVAPYPAMANFYFCPLKVLEYMAAGLPVVASAGGMLNELIVPDRNGLLCPAGDADALANALGCLHDDPALRRRLGQAARATVVAGYSWDSVVQRILDLAASDSAPRPLVEV